jgi:hypothetical protein
MSKQFPPDGERVEKVEIFFELPPSAAGTYRYERSDGTVIHGDASGEWTLDENGDVEDIVFFASPRWMGYGPRRRRSERRSAGDRYPPRRESVPVPGPCSRKGRPHAAVDSGRG